MLRRRSPSLAVLAVLCAIGVAACGSSAAKPASAPTTVTRTVSATPTTTAATTSASSTQTQTPTQTGSGGSATSTGTTTSAGSPPACVAADLSLVSLGGSGATGHLLLGFGLRNTSGHACATGGYPGVLFLGAGGRALPTHPDHTTDDFFGQTVLRQLTVAPGGLVSFRLGVVDVGSDDAGTGCERVQVLQVIPPNDTATLRITRAIDECGGDVSVSPLQVGTTALH